MTISILLVLLAGGMLAWFEVWGRQPVAQEPLTDQKLDAILDALLYRGVAYGGLKPSRFGHVAIRVRDTPIVFVVAKTWSGTEASLRGELPSASWAEPYVAPLCAELDERGIRYVVGDRSGVPLLAVNFGRDLQLAHSVIRVLFERVFGMQLASQCVGYFKNLLPREIPRLTGVARGT